MASRGVAGATVLGVVVGFAAVAVMAGSSVGESPLPLPVRGASSEVTGAGADPVRSSMPASISYEVDGELPELDGEAHAWSVGRGVDVDRIAALAVALGVAGEVRPVPVGWQVSDGKAVLEVQRQPGLPWSFVADGGGGASGASGASGAPSLASPLVAPSPDDEVVCDMPECPPGAACVQVCPPDEPSPPVDLPSRREVVARAGEVAAAAGVDIGAAEVRADRFQVWLVSVDPEVGGLPTVGMATTLTIGSGGTIEYAGGWLAVPERGDAYPLVGTTEALRRVTDDRPVALADGPEPAAECLDCPDLQPVVVTITSVRLGLELVPADGAEEAWLVPAYFFETREGGPGPDLVTRAVSDDHLVAPPEPPVSEPPVGEPPVVEPPMGAPPDGNSEPRCAGVIAGVVAGADQPPELSVCQVSPARAGEPIVFELTASDPDSGIRDDCGSPVVAFGDEADGVAVCDIGCVSLPPGPGELQRTYEHVYAEAGTFTATFTLSGCGPEGHAPWSVSLPVAVAA